MRTFDEFVSKGIIKKQRSDKSMANNLFEESKRKYNSLNVFLDKIGINDTNANDVVEDCYDIIIYLLRAKLLLEGYRALGEGAHEAEISYLNELGFSETDCRILDELRYFRNGIKYYGKRFLAIYATKIVEFLKSIYPKILRSINL